MASDKPPSDDQKPRRSAGMRGSPRNPAPEHRSISTAPKARAEASWPERVSTSRHVKPKMLMGEVMAPRGQEIGRHRDAFRAFMLARHLRPSDWAKAAGVAPGEIMAFLTGHVRSIPVASLEKLARAANCAVEDFFK
ncbi:MAG TPA: helix-turn-helix transcriptional regulator [Rhizomicrobium sp.]|nr:helix-turn-helix transcriptional regulator [Rhizomicrobium sp.]